MAKRHLDEASTNYNDDVYVTYEDLLQNPDMIYMSWNGEPYFKKGFVKEMGNYPSFRDFTVSNINKAIADGSFMINRGELPEVVVKPSAEDKKVLRTLKRILPYKSLRDDFYKYVNDIEDTKLSQNERILKLNKMVKDVKYPVPHKPSALKFVKDYDGRPQPFTTINANDFYNITSFDDYIAELSHALQYKGRKRFGLDTMSPLGGDARFIDDAGDYGGKKNYISGEISKKTPYASNDGYSRPGHYEYNAHQIIEPAIYSYLESDANDNVYDYIKSNIKHKSYLENRTYSLYTPKDAKNILDYIIRKTKLGNRTFNMDNEGNAHFTNTMKTGGAIYIKPENRGKFNATKERTGKTTEELAHSKNPLTRKRAIFAQNTAKWKH